jgi:hypothetical protein
VGNLMGVGNALLVFIFIVSFFFFVLLMLAITPNYGFFYFYRFLFYFLSYWFCLINIVVNKVSPTSILTINVHVSLSYVLCVQCFQCFIWLSILLLPISSTRHTHVRHYQLIFKSTTNSSWLYVGFQNGYYEFCMWCDCWFIPSYVCFRLYHDENKILLKQMMSLIPLLYSFLDKF